MTCRPGRRNLDETKHSQGGRRCQAEAHDRPPAEENAYRAREAGGEGREAQAKVEKESGLGGLLLAASFSALAARRFPCVGDARRTRLRHAFAFKGPVLALVFDRFASHGNSSSSPHGKDPRFCFRISGVSWRSSTCSCS